MRRLAPGSLAVALSIAVIAAADSSWIELKSAHFTVVSNAGDGNTRTIAWQLEQVRSAVAAISPWARVELARPLPPAEAAGTRRGAAPSDVHPEMTPQ